MTLHRFLVCWMRLVVALLAATALSAARAAPPACLTDCTPRIGFVSAFGEEATILIGQTASVKTHLIHGTRYTTGTLRGNRVVIVLSGVSMINSTLVTQTMLDHFNVQRLVMSGISGGVNPAHHVGDVIVPERWAMPMEVYWNQGGQLPSPCGAPGDVSCMGIKLAQIDGRVPPPFDDMFYMRENHVLTAANAPQGEFRFDYEADPAMLAVARSLQPELARCGPRPSKAADGSAGPPLCVGAQPKLVVGGRGVSGTAFLANADYRRYLFEQLHAETFEMETAAFAHVAYVNGVPYIAFRSLSDLAGATAFDADVGALFSSGLAETNESAVTLAFLEAWSHRSGEPPRRQKPSRPNSGVTR